MPKVIRIAGNDEVWDSKKEEFIPPTEDICFTIEHSLVSISLWESKWHKAFLGFKEKNEEELIDYIKCMTLENDISDDVYERLPIKIVEDIKEYMADPMTATTFNEFREKHSPTKVVTSEELYAQMFMLKIPMECQYWHLNRLLTLIRVCAIKNDPNPKKIPRAEAARQRAALNAKRRARLKTRG